MIDPTTGKAVGTPIEPTIVTGHGRSGTHWLAHVLNHFVDAQHEPVDYRVGGDIVVDCRLQYRVDELLKQGYRVMHLVRDGRDVVRSTDEFYKGAYPFDQLCGMWAMAVDNCKGLEVIKVEDITRPRDPSQGHRMSHWRDWPKDMTETFWDICGEGMRRHGYNP